MATLKYSRQRESIREFVKASKEHPTADDVYAAIRKEYPNISLGTVYRNLSLLVELDEIVKVPTGDGPDRFDGNAKPHSHFICTRCHNIFDIEDEHLTGLTERIAKNFDGEIHGHRTTFYGVCKECLENESQELKRKKLVDKKSQVCYIKTVIIIVIKKLKINYQIKKGENSYEKICM